MKRLTFTLYATWLSAILLCTLSVQGMETNFSLTQWCRNQWSALEDYFSNQSPLLPEDYNLSPEEYNNNRCLLTRLPNEILFNIFLNTTLLIKENICHYKRSDVRQGMFADSTLVNVKYKDCYNRYDEPYMYGGQNEVSSIWLSIQNFKRLGIICKKFNTLLTTPETIGNLCKHYTQNAKDQFLQSVSHSYESKFPYALIIVYAGANHNSGLNTSQLLFNPAIKHNDTQFITTLLKHGANPDIGLVEAIMQNNTQCITTLLKHGANPNIGDDDNKPGFYYYKPKGSMYYDYPAFFHIKTPEIAQIFIDNGVNVNVHGYNGSTGKTGNVLWYILGDDYPSELMKLYIKHGVDAKKLLHPAPNPWGYSDGFDPNNSCLLHELANRTGISSKWDILNIKNVDNFLKKGNYSSCNPDMINRINALRYTPSIWLKEFHCAKLNINWGSTCVALERLIALFKERGALTGQEAMKRVPMILLLHKDDYVGDLSILPLDVRKCIVQYIVDFLNR